MRIGTVKAKSLYDAFGLMPWAKTIIETSECYVEFESTDEYIKFIGG